MASHAARPPVAPGAAPTPPTRTRSRSASRSRPNSRPASRGASPLRAPVADARDAVKAAAVAAPDDAVLGEDADLYPPPASLRDAHVNSLEDYRQLHAQSLADPAAFWGKIADEFTWKKKWDAEFTR